MNRAWTDYVPTFAGIVTACAYADTQADYDRATARIPEPFERLEKALERQGGGPFFNGAGYALVDAAYAPFLQRYFFLDRVASSAISRIFRGSRRGARPWWRAHRPTASRPPRSSSSIARP